MKANAVRISMQQAFELTVGADIFAKEHFFAAAINAPNAADKTGVRAEAVDPTAFEETAMGIFLNPTSGEKSTVKRHHLSGAADDGNFISTKPLQSFTTVAVESPSNLPQAKRTTYDLTPLASADLPSALKESATSTSSLASLIKTALKFLLRF
jgi:hypothetical protein